MSMSRPPSSFTATPDCCTSIGRLRDQTGQMSVGGSSGGISGSVTGCSPATSRT